MKCLVFFLNLKNIGVMVEAKVLIILILKVNDEEAKLNLITLGGLTLTKI